MMKEKDSAFLDLSAVNQYLAEYYLKKKQLGAAMKYGRESIRFANKSGNQATLINAKRTYGSILSQMGNVKESIHYLEAASYKAHDYGKENFAVIKQRLAESYASNGEWEKAYQSEKEYNILRDSLSAEALKKNLTEVEAKFQNDARKQEIKILNIQNNSKNILLKEERRNRWYVIGALSLAIMAAVLFFVNLQNKRKANQLLDKKNKSLDQLNVQLQEANQTKAKLFSIISHDLRGPVSQLFTFLKLQQASSSGLSPEAKKHHQDKLMQSSSTLLETMEDLLLWSKSQMNHFEVDKEEIDVDQLFKSVLTLMQAQAEVKNIRLLVAPLKFEFLESDFNMLLAILRNVIQNAINYSFEGTEILIETFTDAQHQMINVHNHGEVVTEERISNFAGQTALKSKSSGYGLMLIKDLAERIGAKLTIRSDVGNGTTISVILNSFK